MNDQERLDDLIIDGLQIYQRSDMFRFSFDAIALIHIAIYKISLLMVLLLIPLFMIVKAVQSLHLKSVI
ncbi:MAG: hypothetical protein E6394_08715 [Veillonella sp.]|nr:hypothetical protein [Veillonella sp.]